MPPLTIENISVIISGKKILEIPLKITIPVGSKVAVFGENGAGKTTLLNCILGHQTYSGTITPKVTAQNTAVVLQKNNYPEFIRTDELIQLVVKDSAKSAVYQKIISAFNLRPLEKSLFRSSPAGNPNG